MYDPSELNFEESFSTESSDLFKDHLDWVELDSLDGDLYNNRVIIELESAMHDKIKTKSGFELFVDNSYDISSYAVRSGRIAKLPKKLTFWDEDEQNGLYWRTTIEAEVGDQVWASGMGIHSGEKIKIKDKLFVFVNYSDLYVCKKQNGVVVCLNGNVLLEPIMRTSEALSFKKSYVDPDYAILRYKGSMNTAYESDYRDDDENLEVGQIVSISGIIPRRLEIKPFLSFDGGNEYIVAQAYELQGFLSE